MSNSQILALYCLLFAIWTACLGLNIVVWLVYKAVYHIAYGEEINDHQRESK
jgi:hypothetical protein